MILKQAYVLKVCTFLAFGFFIIHASANPSHNQPGKDKRIDSLKQLLSETIPDTSRIDVLNTLAIILHYKQADAAVAYSKEALELCYKINNNQRKYFVLNTAGNSYLFVSNFSQAIFYYLQAYRLCGNDKKRLYTVLNNLGLCYIYLDQYETAKKYLQEVLNDPDHNAASQKAEVLVTIHSNLGVIALNQGKKDSALYHFNQSLKFCRDKSRMGNVYLNIGNAYAELKQLRLALTFYKKAYPFIGDKIQYEIEYYSSLASVYMELKDYAKAKEYYFRALNTVKQSEVSIYESELYHSIATMFEKQQDYKKAYLYLNKYKTVEDSDLNVFTTEKITAMQESYELGKRDDKILLLSQNQLIAEGKSYKQRLVSIALILALMSVLAFSRTRILKQKAKYKEEKSQVELQKQKVEKDHVKLLHENTEARYESLKSKTDPHFLFNSLTALSSVVRKDQVLAAEHITHFAALYRTILKTGNQNIISLQEEMETVSHYLHMQKMQFREKLVIDIGYVTEDPSYFVPPFAVQMVVENVIKHNTITRSKNLKIRIYTDQECIFIINNLQKKKANVVSTFIGQKSITDRYALLSGIKPIFIETENEYRVTLPLLTPGKLNQPEKQAYLI